MARMFGTDGVRGVAGTELSIELAMKLGQAGAYVLTREKAHQPTIIVGCDTRISGGMLANALMAGICSVGANAVYMGVMPTPAIAYLTKKHKEKIIQILQENLKHDRSKTQIVGFTELNLLEMTRKHMCSND